MQILDGRAIAAVRSLLPCGSGSNGWPSQRNWPDGRWPVMKSSWTERQSRLSLGHNFKLSRIFGVFPLRLQNGIFVVSSVGLFTSALMTVILILSLYVHIVVPAPAVYATPVTDALNIAQILGCEVVILASVCSVIRFRPVLSDVLNTLVQFEYAMFRLGVELKPLRWYIWCMGTILVTWMVFGLGCYSLDYVTFSTLFYTFSHYYLITLIVLVNSQICWIGGYIASAFSCLTVALEASGDLHQLVRWHRRLTVSCRMLSKVYSMEILILFGTSLVSCTVEAYLTYNILMTRTLVHIAVCVYWTCILYSICFKIIYTCVQAKSKAMEFDAAVYKSIVFNKQGDFSFYGPACRLYFHFQSRGGVTFDVLGFFQIDWQLARTMIGAGIAYLVILVQFS